jgi:hypothetical protein
MAYASSVQEPFEMAPAGLAQTTIPLSLGPSTANSSLVTTRPRLWGYLSTADALTTVTASSYFSDGFNRGMRPGDIVHVTNSTSTTSSTGVTVTRAVVTAYTSSSGGVNLTTSAIQN